MPPAKKTAVKKKTTKTKKRKPVTANKKIAEADLFLPEKKFINIYERDPIIESKSRLAWLIVAVIMIAIISFWFWSLKISLKNNNDSNDFSSVNSEIDNIVKEFKTLIGNTKDIVDQVDNQTGAEAEIEKIKNNVLDQIKINSDSTNWPVHTSELIKTSFKYPTNWYKQEDKNAITITSYDLNTTTTPVMSADIVIVKKSKTSVAKIIEDLNNLEIVNNSYQLSTE